MYLIDTVVLSELRKRQRHPGLVQWLREKAAATLFLSVVTIGEIERGILRQRSRDPAFADVLAAWPDRAIEIYADRILAVDMPIARCWGRLSARIGPRIDHDGADLLIAATALERELIVVTPISGTSRRPESRSRTRSPVRHDRPCRRDGPCWVLSIPPAVEAGARRIAIDLQTGDPQTGDAVAVDRLFPGPELFDRQVVAVARLFETDPAAAYGGDDDGLAPHDPSLGIGWRQLGCGRRLAAVHPEVVRLVAHGP
jgi:predicted nucleic acid-binding protein